MLVTNKYLYNRDDVPAIPSSIIKQRLTMLDSHLQILLEVPMLNRDVDKVRKVLKALHFWSTINSQQI